MYENKKWLKADDAGIKYASILPTIIQGRSAEA